MNLKNKIHKIHYNIKFINIKIYNYNNSCKGVGN